MLNKNHLGKVPRKAAESWKLKGPYNTTGYQVNVYDFPIWAWLCQKSNIYFCFVNENEFGGGEGRGQATEQLIIIF